MTEVTLSLSHDLRVITFHQSCQLLSDCVNELIVVRIGMVVTQSKFEVDEVTVRIRFVTRLVAVQFVCVSRGYLFDPLFLRLARSLIQTSSAQI